MTITDYLSFASLRIMLAPVALLVAACTPVGGAEDNSAAPTLEEATNTHPISGLEIIDVTIVSGNGRHTFKTEVADTPEAQTRGLMFRTELADDEAMIFPQEIPQTSSFWMRNTPISLDIMFVGTDGRITNIAERAEPYSLDSLASAGLASAVFEVRGGLSEELGIGPGDAVEYQLPENPSE